MTKDEFLQAAESAEIVLANFKKDGQVHPLIARVLQRVEAENDGVKVIEFDLEALSDLVEQYLEEMDPLTGTLDFSYPGLVLYREGKLITTFQPWMNLNNNKLNEDLVNRQLKVFLARLVPQRFGSEAAQA